MQSKKVHLPYTSQKEVFGMRCACLQIHRVGKLLGVNRSYESSLQHLRMIERSFNHKGNRYTLTLFKYYYDVCKALCLDTMVPQLPSNIWIRVNKVGVPRVVARLIRENNLNLDDINHKRFLLSLFSLYELGRVHNPVCDIKSLTDPVTSIWTTKTINHFKSFLNEEKDIKSLFHKIQPKQIKDYVSIKGGPYGPSTPSWVQDLLAISCSTDNKRCILDIESKLGLVNKTSGLDEALNFLEKSIRVFGDEVSVIPNTKILSTLGIPDKGPKVRTITKGNYYLQRALKPLHDNIMTILKNIEEDGTYKQDKASKRVKSWTKFAQPNCFDLTAATDRMPVWIQHLVLDKMGFRFANQWGSIMSQSRSFDEDNERFFNFTVGQPMGLYSSWAAFSITHHLILRFAFFVNKKSHKNGYSIIGDDMSVLDDNVAQTYKELILGLGIKISEAKSITRFTCKGKLFVGEMAKRLYIKGDEISPVRPSELVSLRNSSGWINIKEFALTLHKRWGPTITWKAICARKTNHYSPTPSSPILSFLKIPERHLGRMFLESPLGGPRMFLFEMDYPSKSERALQSPDGALLYKVTSQWQQFSKEWVAFATQQINDKELDKLLQKIVDVVTTLELISKETSRVQEPDHTLSENYSDFHEKLWTVLGINPFYQALKSLEKDIISLNYTDQAFLTENATVIMDRIHHFSIQIDLAHGWLSGEIKRDLSDLKSKKRKAAANRMIAIYKSATNPRIKFLKRALKYTVNFRNVPSPTEVDIHKTYPRFYDLSRNKHVLLLGSGDVRGGSSPEKA